MNLNLKLTTNDVISKLNNTWLGYNYDSNNAHDMNDILRNTEGTSIFYDSNIPYTSGVLDLQLIRNIYMPSPNLGNFNTIGPQSESTIIKKNPVTADYNQMILDAVMVSNDYLDCSKQTWRRLEFQQKC